MRVIGDLDADGHTDYLAAGQIAFGTGDPAFVTAAASIDAATDPHVLRLDIPGDDTVPGGPDDARPVPDVTGDGRPELAARRDGVAMIFASDQLVRGGTITIPREADVPYPDNEGDEVVGPDPVLDPTGVTALRIVQQPTSTQQPEQAQIEHTGPDGAITRGAVLELRGTPDTLQRDPASGELIVGATREAGRRTTLTSVLHLDAAGGLLARTTLRNAGTLRFGPDGPDPDATAEVFAQTREGIRVLPSGARGAVPTAGVSFVTDPRGHVLPAFLPSKSDGDGEGAASHSLSVTGLGDWKFPSDHWSRLLPLG